MKREFNPFDVIPGLPGLAQLRTHRLLLALPVLLALLVGATIIDGTTGGLQDVRPLDDLCLALGVTRVDSPPSFPLMRDFLTMWVVLVIALTLVIVHRQWNLMSTCVQDLERTGAIVPRAAADRSRLLRAGERLFPGSDEKDPDPLDTVMRHAREYVALLRSKLMWPLILAALVGSAVILIGVRPSLFSEVVPAEITPPEEVKWLGDAYSSWWAGPNHPAGAIVYFAIFTLGIYLVLMQNAIGLACSYFVITLPSVARLDADWLDRDGLYGWRPIALIFRTVYWSLILHGVTLAFVVIALGSDHVLLIMPLLAIWVIAAPIYIGGSILAFRRVERMACDERLATVDTTMRLAGVTANSPPPVLTPFLAEINRARNAKIRPLSLGRLRESAIFTAFILPLLLAAAQLAAV